MILVNMPHGTLLTAQYQTRLRLAQRKIQYSMIEKQQRHEKAHQKKRPVEYHQKDKTLLGESEVKYNYSPELKKSLDKKELLILNKSTSPTYTPSSIAEDTIECSFSPNETSIYVHDKDDNEVDIFSVSASSVDDDYSSVDDDCSCDSDVSSYESIIPLVRPIPVRPFVSKCPTNTNDPVDGNSVSFLQNVCHYLNCTVENTGNVDMNSIEESDTPLDREAPIKEITILRSGNCCLCVPDQCRFCVNTKNGFDSIKGIKSTSNEMTDADCAGKDRKKSPCVGHNDVVNTKDDEIDIAKKLKLVSKSRYCHNTSFLDDEEEIVRILNSSSSSVTNSDVYSPLPITPPTSPASRSFEIREGSVWRRVQKHRTTKYTTTTTHWNPHIQTRNHFDHPKTVTTTCSSTHQLLSTILPTEKSPIPNFSNLMKSKECPPVSIIYAEEDNKSMSTIEKTYSFNDNRKRSSSTADSSSIELPYLVSPAYKFKHIDHQYEDGVESNDNSNSDHKCHVNETKFVTSFEPFIRTVKEGMNERTSDDKSSIVSNDSSIVSFRVLPTSSCGIDCVEWSMCELTFLLSRCLCTWSSNKK